MIVDMRLKTFPGNLKEKIRGVADRVASPAHMLAVGGVAKTLIVTRTLKGKSVSGEPFQPYSTTPIYVSVTNRPPGVPAPRGGRKTRGKKGQEEGTSMFFEGGYKEYREGLGRPTGIRTLSLTNTMLGDIQVRASRGLAVLYFGGALSSAKAHGHHYGTNALPESEFFDINHGPIELGELERETAKLIQEDIEKAGLN